MPQIKIIHMQPSDTTDHITEDGTELTRRPYPFEARIDNGMLLNQRMWKGDPLGVVGFTDDPSANRLSLRWDEVDPDNAEQLINKYLVTRNREGRWSSWPSAVQSVEFFEVEEKLMQEEPS